MVLLVTCVGCGGPLAGRGTEDAPLPARVLDPGCPGSAYATLKDAIDAAVDHDVVEVCAGTYVETVAIVGKRLTLRSASGAASTVLDAAGLGRALSVTDDAIVTVEGLTIRNGLAATEKGGNVWCSRSNLLLRDNVVETGEALRGGGLGTSSCTGRIERNTFRANHATIRGGGLYVDGTIDLLGNTFDGNVADADAGAAYVTESFAVIRDNLVVGNRSEDDGGGIFVYSGAPWIDANVFEDNDSGEEGGGLRVKSSEAVITDNVFTRNHADWRGGAMKHSHDESVFRGNTYVDNDADGDAGALLLFESASILSSEHFEGNEADDGGAVAIVAGWGDVTIEDSTFVDNEADDLGGHLYVDLPLYTVALRRVDLVDGRADEGGAVYAIGSDLDLGNVVLASNTARDAAGAVALDATTGRIHNAIAIWNDAPDGAALRVTNGLSFEVVNTVFEGNTGGAAVSNVYGLLPPWGLPPTLRYDDFYGNASTVQGMWSPIGFYGNVAVPTGFVDPAGGDWSLLPSSALRDAGDPAIRDADDSRSDIGRFGGPDAH